MSKILPEKTGNEDFVAHRDILSSPDKSRSVSPSRQPFEHHPKSKHSSPSKKNALETVQTSPPVTALSLSETLSVASLTSNSPVKVEEPPKRKRGRPRKVVTATKVDADAADLQHNNKHTIGGTSPENKRRKGRPRKEEVLARMKLKQEEESKKREMGILPEVKEETAKIIKGDLSTENIIPSRLPRRTTLQPKRKMDIDDKSSDEDSVVSDADSTQEFNSDAVVESEDEDVVEELFIDEDDKVVNESSEKPDEEKPKRKRGRPSKVDSDIPILEPLTPRKADYNRAAPRDFNFVSPLKKTILDNLQQYKTNGTSASLRLDKNFVPAPLPNTNYKARQTVTKANDFLDTFEGFFDQRKPTRSRGKSTNTMAMAPEITREEFALISNTFNKLFLKRKRDKLYELHYKMFPQYWFELTQGFTLLFYGVGSKREFLEKFAIEYLSPKLTQIQLYLNKDQTQSPSSVSKQHTGIPCIVVNGYNPTCSYRDVFKDISKILFPEQLTSNETKYWGNHVSLQVSRMIEFYEKQPHDIKLILVIHNIDGPSVRKEAFQTMLSSLSVIKQIAIVASADHIYAPVLWDNKKSQNYNFIFHDVTNYEPYSVESSFQDVMKMGKREATTGAEGAKYVLESLTINSKKLFKVLVETQITKMESDNNGKKVPPMKRPSLNTGLEFKHLAQRCAHEFIASNDISLRTMLREFIEHNMTNISRTNAGVEYVWVPYNYSELNRLKDTVLANVA